MEEEDYEYALSSYLLAKKCWRLKRGSALNDLAICYANIANSYDGLGQNEKATINYKVSLKLFTNLHEAPHPDIADCHHDLSHNLFGRVKLKAALGNIDQAVSIYSNCAEQDNQTFAKYHDLRDNILRATGDQDD